MSAGLSAGGREGDVGGGQGLPRVSLEALHSDIDQGIAGAGAQGWGLPGADGHLVYNVGRGGDAKSQGSWWAVLEGAYHSLPSGSQ